MKILSNNSTKATLISLSENGAVIQLPEGIDPKELLPYRSLLEHSWQSSNNTQNRINFEFQASNATPAYTVSQNYSLNSTLDIFFPHLKNVPTSEMLFAESSARRLRTLRRRLSHPRYSQGRFHLR